MLIPLKGGDFSTGGWFLSSTSDHHGIMFYTVLLLELTPSSFEGELFTAVCVLWHCCIKAVFPWSNSRVST